MVIPWNHPPGKIFYPNKAKGLVEKALKERAEWEEKWDSIFGEKKLNNMEDDDVSEEQQHKVQEGGEASDIKEE